MSRKRLELGAAGEEMAVHYLTHAGYKIIDRNYRCALGEIDIIAQEKDTLCFIEVKTRVSLDKGFPEEAVTITKQRQLMRVALSYLKAKGGFGSKARFDVVSVIVSEDESAPVIKLIKNAFELSGFYT